jgi:hypothetical protein
MADALQVRPSELIKRVEERVSKESAEGLRS